MTFHSAGGGGYGKLLQTVDLAGLSLGNLTAFDSNAYLSHEVLFHGVRPSTDGAEINLRSSSDGGSNFDSGGADYTWGQYGRHDTDANAYCRSYGDPGHNCIILIGVGNLSTETFNGTVWVTNPGLALGTDFHFMVTGRSPDAGRFFHTMSGGGQRISAAIVNALQVFPSAGNFTSGMAYLFGIKGA